MGSLKRFISLNLDPAGFVVMGPSLHQLSSQRAKAIRKQWKRNTTVFTFLIVLARRPDFPWKLFWGWLLKIQGWLRKEIRVFQVTSLPSRWPSNGQNPSPAAVLVFAHISTHDKIVLRVSTYDTTGDECGEDWAVPETGGPTVWDQSQRYCQMEVYHSLTKRGLFFNVLQCYPCIVYENEERKSWSLCSHGLVEDLGFVVSHISIWLLTDFSMVFSDFLQVFQHK